MSPTEQEALLFKAIWAHWDENPQMFKAIEEFISMRVWKKPREFGLGRAMAVVDDSKVVAGLIYHNYDADAGVIEISAAADTPRWLTKSILREMFEFPFLGLGCQAVAMRCDAQATNNNLSRILPSYGFKRYDIPRLRGRNTVEAVYVLSDDDWKANKFNRTSL